MSNKIQIRGTELKANLAGDRNIDREPRYTSDTKELHIYDPWLTENVTFKDKTSVNSRYEFPTDPTINDDNTDGYLSGDTWFNTVTKELFTLGDNSTGAAVWATGVSGGKVAIYDANGKPTFYNTIQDAVAVGGLIHIFANITTTSTINMVQGTSINLNGFSITMSNDDATNLITFVGDAGGYTGKPFFNGKLLRTGRANNSTGAVIALNNAGGSINYFFNFEGVEIVNTYGKGVIPLNTGLTFQFENIKVNSYNTCLDLNSAGIGGWIKKANLSSIVAWAVSKSGAVINVYQSVLFSVSEYAVFGSVDTYGCTLESTTWVVVAGGSHYNGTIRTGSFYAASGASLYKCTVSSTLNYGVFQCPVVEDCHVTSVTSNACYSSVIGAVIVGGTLTSLGAASTINSAASVNSKFTNVTIQNKGTGHGVDGGNTDSVYKNCNFIISDGTKNAISTGTTPRWMQCNFSANLTNPTAALVNAQVNTADNYGNIQEG
jgi:hypothetical protein